MSGCSFSLDHYRELIEQALSGGYRFVGFDAPPRTGDLILRHDVDLSLEAAVEMATLEAELEVSSTWFLMTRSVFYNLGSSQGERELERLRELGGRIGHHAVWPHVDLDARFEPLVAWHNPERDYMSAPVADAVNVMAPPWFESGHYRSDSNQHWRGGCPHASLGHGELEWLQLLIHPEIWVYEGASMGETMEAFLDAERPLRRELLRADRIELS